MRNKKVILFFYSFLIFLGIGLTAVIWPGHAIGILTYLIGIMGMLYGIYHTVVYFIRHKENNEIIIGIVSFAVGGGIILHPDVFVNLITVLLGLCLVFDGTVKLQASFEIRKDGYTKWVLLLILSCLMIALGIVIVAFPISEEWLLSRLIGSCLLLNSGINLMNGIVVMVYNIRKNGVDGEDENLKTAGENNELSDRN